MAVSASRVSSVVAAVSRRLCHARGAVSRVVLCAAVTWAAACGPTITDCGLYGDPKALGDSEGPGCSDPKTEYYAGACYRKCPAGLDRTAVCTCTSGSLTTDCGLYGVRGSAEPTCNPGTAYWGGLCYTDQCEQDGGYRTASCTCDFGSFDRVDWNCGDCDPGSHKTSVCTCQWGGVVSDCDRYGHSEIPTYACPPGTEPYGVVCHGSCPKGAYWRRVGPCTCGNIVYDADCSKYGLAGAPDSCPAGRELYLSTCVKACPRGSIRVGACSCRG